MSSGEAVGTQLNGSNHPQPTRNDQVEEKEKRDKLEGPSSPSSYQNGLSPTSETDLNLRPAPLATQPHQLLDPTLTNDFDPDAFLVSRTPGTDLASISKELSDYSKLLSTELVDVINDDYRPFIQLGR